MEIGPLFQNNLEIESQVSLIVKIAGDSGATSASRTGSGSGNTAVGGRVDREKVESLLAALRQLYVQEFVADLPSDLTTYGLNRPKTVLTVQTPLLSESSYHAARR